MTGYVGIYTPRHRGRHLIYNMCGMSGSVAISNIRYYSQIILTQTSNSEVRYKYTSNRSRYRWEVRGILWRRVSNGSPSGASGGMRCKPTPMYRQTFQRPESSSSGVDDGRPSFDRSPLSESNQMKLNLGKIETLPIFQSIKYFL